MLVTLSGILTLVRLVQPENAPPMLVTLPGIVTLVRLVQDKNARFSMLVTLPGIVTLVRRVLYWNAADPMAVTGRPLMVDGMVTALPLPEYQVMVMAEPSDL